MIEAEAGGPGPRVAGGVKSDSRLRPLSVTKTLETTPEGLGKGELFAGRFELIEELGAGGMGIVYRAYDKQVGEEIALKILHPEIALDERTVDRFRSEIRLARRISHRNVCRMHELHEDGKTLFITMEYVSGQDLKGLIRETKGLMAGKAISIAKQVAEGLCEAHNLGVIHRDLKPQNIMVDKEGTAKIMDFGIARSLRAAGMTAEGMIIGTPEYMAPEQVEGLEADQRTDLYAMGAILFEMVTGRVPFEGDSPLSVAYKHKNEIPISPLKLNAEIPETFNKLILRCLEKQKENRYQTAEELLADLIRIEEGLPISERVALPARPTIRIAREKPTGVKRFLIPALGVLVLALAAFIVLRILPKRQPLGPFSTSGKPSIAVLYFENLSGDPALDVWRTGLTELLIASLSQSKLIAALDANRTYGILKQLGLDQAKKYSREDLIKVADAGKTTYTASGSLMKAGASLIIMLTLQRPRTGEVVDSFKLTCPDEADLLAKTDELTDKIKSAMDLSAAQVADDKGLAMQKITASPEALKYYLESRRYYLTAEYPKVIGLCEKALEIDPQFALAYYMMNGAYRGMRNGAKAQETIAKAFELRDRVTARERYLIEANYYVDWDEKAPDKAMAAFQNYLELSPDDGAEMVGPGLLYMNFGDLDKSLELMKRAYGIERSIQTFDPLILTYELMGRYQEAAAVAREYLKGHSGEPAIHWYALWPYLLQKDYNQALAEIELGFLADPSWEWSTLRALVYLYRGDLADAEKGFLQVIAKEPGENGAGARRLRMPLYVLQGKFERARAALVQATAPGGDSEAEADGYVTANLFLRLKEYDRALRIIENSLQSAVADDNPRRQKRALWWKGLAEVGRKDIAGAEKTLAELKALGERYPNKQNIKYFWHLQGLIDLEKSDYSGAAASLRTACSAWWHETPGVTGVPTHALYLYPLASAYFRSGDLDEARVEFEKVTNLTTGRLHFGDLYAKSFYWLGKIAEAQKDKARARENYGKFLDLWKDADPGQPEVDEAKARLAVLK
jgi:eukaryotic-like serine/threonine-protein kinase